MKFKNSYAIIAALLFANQVTGQTLDQTFGQSGSVVLSSTYGIARQADGKLVTVGFANTSGVNDHVTTTRYTVSGALDATFGMYGVLADPIDTFGNSTGTIVQISLAQKIVVAGFKSNFNYSHNNTVIRYTSSGTRDSSFGLNGEVTGDTVNQITDLKIQPDEKIIVCLSDSILKRFNADGSIDTGFGNGGLLVLNHTIVQSLLLQPDGKILLAGARVDSANAYYRAIGRLLPNGHLDNTFGANGFATAMFSVSSNPAKLSLDSNGKIVMMTTGFDTTRHAWSLTVFRFGSNGILDSSFHNGFFPSGADTVYSGVDVVMQPDQKILIAVNSTIKNSSASLINKCFVLRLSAGGQVDNNFGENGLFEVPGLGDRLALMHMLLQPDGKIVLQGSDGSQNSSFFEMMRYSIDETTGVASSSLALSPISVYPNPASTQIFIDLSKAQIKTDCHFILFDITGKTIASGTLQPGINTISTSLLTGGVYLVQVVNGTEKMVSRIVKQ